MFRFNPGWQNMSNFLYTDAGRGPRHIALKLLEMEESLACDPHARARCASLPLAHLLPSECIYAYLGKPGVVLLQTAFQQTRETANGDKDQNVRRQGW
jgi:hypothetical protein